ncbi:hypothetical protein Tco_1478659, partial [Tanacetum coccineum]
YKRKSLIWRKPRLLKQKEIASLKKRVKQLEKRKRLITPRLKRLRKDSKVVDLDADAEVTLVDKTQEMNDDNLMFDTDVLEEQEKEVAEQEVSTANPVTTAKIKAAKPKAVTSAATTTTTRPKARGVVVQELSEFKTTSSPLSQAKDKGKALMVEPERPLKKKD